MPLQVHSIPTALSVSHLVATDQGMILIDSGGPGSAQPLMRCLRKLGRNDLQAIFITHAHIDHYGSAAALRRRTGAAIGVHQSDAQAVAFGASPVTSGRGIGRLIVALGIALGSQLRACPTPPDLELADGDNVAGLGVPARVLHTPGHTDGSACLIVDGRLAFVGDLLSGWLRPRLQHVFAVEWSQLPLSLARLQAAGPEWVYVGHRARPVSGAVLQAITADGRH